MTKEIASLSEVRFDQGTVGHDYCKPTTLLTDVEEMKQLDGQRVAQGMTQGWPGYLKDRMNEAKMAAEWAPGLCDLIKTAIRRKWGQSRWRSNPGTQRRGALPQMARGPARAAALGNGLKQDEKVAAAMWAAHYHAGHVPFRRDCAVCLEAAGRDRPRKAVPHPSAYTWSLDLMGPFVESHDQELPYARYGLVTVATIPTREELVASGTRTTRAWGASSTFSETCTSAVDGGWPHLWRIVKKSQEERLACGYLAIYVDDVLAAAEKKVLKSFFKAVKKLWRCSEEEMVSQDAWMRFCGYELKSDGEGGFVLSQEHYVRDLLNRRRVTGRETVPLPKICEGEDEEMCGQALKEAQGVVGELQWIPSRTRPDVAYGTGLLARMMHRRPRYTVQLAEHLLRYLRASETRSLRYRTGDGGEDLQPMVVSTDASFAPEHEQFRSVTGIIIHHRCNVLQWVSMRQPFVSQSTCEAELIAFAEGRRKHQCCPPVA